MRVCHGLGSVHKGHLFPKILYSAKSVLPLFVHYVGYIPKYSIILGFMLILHRQTMPEKGRKPYARQNRYKFL